MHSYTRNYFEINDILCTEERVLCKMEQDLPGLGFLDASSESENLKRESSLELPVWLAQELTAFQNPIVSVDLPIIYKDGYRQILQADACAVALTKWNSHYYELGMYLRQLTDSEKITDCLLQTFKSRSRLVMDWAQNPISDPTLANQLPRLERELFLTGNRAKLRLNDWLRRGTAGIETSEVAANLKKRKRTDYELN